MSKALLELMEPVLKERDQKNFELGISQGISQGMVIAYYNMNLSTGEIANKLHLEQKDVEQIIKDFKKL